MRKFNVALTITFVVIALIMWADMLWFLMPTDIGRSERFHIAQLLTLLACVGWVLVTIASFRQDDYTRCRKCRHILRGISEPRCPECGEPI